MTPKSRVGQKKHNDFAKEVVEGLVAKHALKRTLKTLTNKAGCKEAVFRHWGGGRRPSSTWHQPVLQEDNLRRGVVLGSLGHNSLHANPTAPEPCALLLGLCGQVTLGATLWPTTTSLSTWAGRRGHGRSGLMPFPG